MKRIIVSLVTIIAAIVAAVMINPADVHAAERYRNQADGTRLYPALMICTGFDGKEGYTELETQDGNAWLYDYMDDVELYDVFVVIMDDNNTKYNVTDDYIVALRYSGFTWEDME